MSSLFIIQYIQIYNNFFGLYRENKKRVAIKKI